MVGKKRAGGASQAQVNGETGGAQSNRRRSARGQKVEESQQVLDAAIAEQGDFSNALVPVIDYPGRGAAQGYHLVVDVDNPGNDGYQEFTYEEIGLAPLPLDYVNGNELEVYQDFTPYNEPVAGTSSAAAVEMAPIVPRSMALEKTAPGPSTGVFLQPGQLVVTGVGGKAEQIPMSELLYGKYAFPRKLTPYNPGSRTFCTLSKEEMDEIHSNGSRNFTTYRSVIAEGSALNAIEEYRQQDKSRRRNILNLARMNQNHKEMRAKLEEDNSRLRAEHERLLEENARIKNECQAAISKFQELEASTMADQKTAEQIVFHEKKFHEVVEGIKAEYQAKLLKYKIDQEKLKSWKKKYAKLRKLHLKTKNKTTKPLIKSKDGSDETVEVPVGVEEPAINENDLATDNQLISEADVEQIEREEKEKARVEEKVGMAMALVAKAVVDSDVVSLVKQDLTVSDDDGAGDAEPEPDCSSQLLKTLDNQGNESPELFTEESEYFTNTEIEMLPGNSSRLSDSEEEGAINNKEKAKQAKQRGRPRKQRTKSIDLGLSDTEGSVDETTDTEKKNTKTEIVNVPKEKDLRPGSTPSPLKQSIAEVEHNLNRGQQQKRKKGRKRARKGTKVPGMSKKLIAELEEEALKGEEYNELTKRKRTIKRETLKEMKASPKKEDKPTEEPQPPIPKATEVKTKTEKTVTTAISPSPPTEWRRTSRRRQLIDKIGDTTLPQPVVASCDKVKLTKQIERARENKRKSVPAAAEEPASKKLALTVGETTQASVPVVKTSNPPRKSRGVETPVRIAPDLIAYDSPRSPPIAGPSKLISCGTGPVDAASIKAAAAVLDKHFHGKTLEKLKETSSGLFCHALTNKLCSPVPLARAIFAALMDKTRKEDADTLVERLSFLIQMVETSKLEQFQRFTDIILQGFGHSISDDCANAQNSADFVYKRMGEFYGKLVEQRTASAGPGSQNELALDIILDCMYCQPDRAFAFLLGFLRQHSDPLNMYKNVYNEQNCALHFQMILYVIKHGRKGSTQATKLLRNFTNQSLAHFNLFREDDQSKFIQGIFPRLKELESDGLIRKTFKALGMFSKHFDDGTWNWILVVAKPLLENIWNEYNDNKVHDGILSQCLLMISEIVGLTRDIRNISDLQQVLAQIGTDNEEVSAAAMKCMDKLNEFNSVDHLINLKNKIKTEKKQVADTPATAAAKGKGKGRGRGSGSGGKGKGKAGKQEATAAPAAPSAHALPVPTPPMKTPSPPLVGLASERQKRANRGKKVRMSF